MSCKGRVYKDWEDLKGNWLALATMHGLQKSLVLLQAILHERRTRETIREARCLKQ